MFYIDAKVTFTDKTQELLPQHGAFLNRLFDEGVFVMFGMNKTVQGHGTIIARASSMESLRARLEEDPFMAEGLIEYHIEEFAPSRIAENITDL